MAIPIADLDKLNRSELSTTDRVVIDDVSESETKYIEVADLLGIPQVGWTSSGETWAFASWNATTRIGVITVPTNATTKYSPGMRVNFSQTTGGSKYGIIHAVTSTTLTVFFPTGTTFNNEALTTPVYSPLKSPFGFPGDPALWAVGMTDSNNYSTSSTTYVATGMTLTVGPGAWNAEVAAPLVSQDTTTLGRTSFWALSTTTNSMTNSNLANAMRSRSPSAVNNYNGNRATARDDVNLASTTTFNLLYCTTSGIVYIEGGTLVPTLIRFKSNYL